MFWVELIMQTLLRVDVISGCTEVKGQVLWTRTHGLTIFEIEVGAQNLML